MDFARQLDKFEDLMCTAMTDVSALDAAMDVVAEACETHLAQFVFVGQGNTHLQSAFSKNLNEDFVELEQVMWGLNPRVAKLPTMKSQTIVTDKDCIAYDDVRLNPVYQELFIPMGGATFAGGIVNQSDSYQAALGIFDGFEVSSLHQSQVSKLAQIMQRAAPIFALSDRMVDMNAAALLDQIEDGRAAFTLDGEGRIISRNAAAVELLRSGRLNQTVDRRIDLLRIGAKDRFDAFVRREAVSENRFLVQQSTGEAEMIMTLSHLPTPFFRSRSRKLILLVIDDLRRPNSLETDFLQQLYGLTQAETDLANALMTGLSLENISEMRNVSVSTTRTQVKSVMSKTGTRRQAELVAKLAKLIRRGG